MQGAEKFSIFRCDSNEDIGMVRGEGEKIKVTAIRGRAAENVLASQNQAN